MANSMPLKGSFTCRKSVTWDRRFYFPSEGRNAEDFFALKNPTALAGFESVNLGTRGQHATPKPQKPLSESPYLSIKLYCIYVCYMNTMLYIVILSAVSPNRSRSWNVLPTDTGALLYLCYCLSQLARFEVFTVA
jgi:hypothetical protein